MDNRVMNDEIARMLLEVLSISDGSGRKYDKAETIKKIISRLMDGFEDSPEADEIRKLLFETIGAIDDAIDEGKDENEERTDEEKERFDEKLDDIYYSICEFQDSAENPEEETIRFLENIIGEEWQARMRKMDPESRRQYCADMAAENSRDYGNETGKFFIAIAGARGKRLREAGRELGEKIMDTRNAIRLAAKKKEKNRV